MPYTNHTQTLLFLCHRNINFCLIRTLDRQKLHFPSVLHHTLLSPLLSQFFLKLPSHFPSNTTSHSHRHRRSYATLINHSFLLHREPFLVQQLPAFPELHPANSCSCCHSCLTTTACSHPIPEITNLSPFPPLHTTPPPNPSIHHPVYFCVSSMDPFPAFHT